MGCEMRRLIFIFAVLPFCLLANTNWVSVVEEKLGVLEYAPVTPMVMRFPDGTVRTNYQLVAYWQRPCYTNDYWESVRYQMMPRPDFVTEWEEFRNRMDILWCDYTNRMARAEERREKMRLVKERVRSNENGKPPKKPLRFSAPEKMIKRGNLNLKAERSAK